MMISLKDDVKTTDNIQMTKNVKYLQRCKKCFILHTPYIKFCRWAKVKQEKKKNLSKVPSPISEEISRLIKSKISSLEKGHENLNNEPAHLEKISNLFFEKSCFSSKFPEICFETFSTIPESKGKLKDINLRCILSHFYGIWVLWSIFEHENCFACTSSF